MNKASDMIERGAKYGRIAFWILFCFIFITFTVAIVAWMIGRGNLKGQGKRALAKFFLVFYGVMLLLLWILIFIMIVGNVILGATCGMVKELNNGNKGILDMFTMSDITKSTINQCFFKDSEGDLSKLYNTYTPGSQEFILLDSSIQNMYQLFDGVSGYVKWKGRADSTTSSKSLPIFTKELQKFQTGSKYDFTDVQSTLQRFNDLVKCENKRYELQAVCNGADNCLEIINIATYVPADCISDKGQVQALFTALKNYQTDENQYVSTLLTPLNNPTQNSLSV